ncbi:hypothetical protein AJ80_05924 [Polytolypa hystricis UAMH7299]|uniref:N-acetyltransferase domain-containing protein n=1 Tax=Polytolypa hystricis (strain UAMH7299) TaxID=1447883 RepID=A0A2B7XZY2_POLH7|nr:hypothetical protein AJ80_05924 [Polytolypa hystricis UAMH7299]
MSLEISLLTEQDIPGAVECIQRAFEGDPYFLWVFDDQAKFSKKRNVASLHARCQWGINNALFYVAKQPIPAPEEDDNDEDMAVTEDQSKNQDQQKTKKRAVSSSSSRVVGVSMWLPPHPASELESWHSYFQSWILSFRQMLCNIRFLGRGGLNLKRYWIWKECQERAQREVWTDPRGYYFCNVLAVLPGCQGKGIGRKLMDVVMRQADVEDAKCYLESSKGVPNVEIYGRMGFKTMSEMDCADGDVVCRLYCMVREPKLLN